MTTTMLINTTEGLRPAKTSNLTSSDPTEVTAFLAKNCTTYGMSVQYVITRDGQVISIIKRGKLGKKLVKQLIEKLEVTEWVYSWAWAGKTFEINGNRVEVKTLDLMSNTDVLEAYCLGRSLDF